MATRKEKVNAGLFLLIGTLLLIGAVAVVAGLRVERRGELFTVKIAKSVGGLREGAAVNYLGVPVGRVKEVDFPAEDIEAVSVQIEITRRSTPIKTGTFATLSSNFLTGETSIDLQGGANNEVDLPPGSIVNWRPTTLMRLEDALPSVLDELKHVVQNLSELLSDDNRSAFKQLVTDADTLAADLRAQVVPVATDLHELKVSLSQSGEFIAREAEGLRIGVNASIDRGAADLKAAAASVQELVVKLAVVADQLEQGTSGMGALVATIMQSAERLDAVLAGTQGLLQENRSEVGRALANVRRSAIQLEELLTTLQSDPSQLLFASPPAERRRGEN